TPTILMITLLPTTISSLISRDNTSMFRLPLLTTGDFRYEECLPQAPYPGLDGGRPHSTGTRSDVVQREPTCTPVISMRRQQKSPCRRTRFFEGAIVACSLAARHERRVCGQSS